jgi:hypothetical protein
LIDKTIENRKKRKSSCFEISGLNENKLLVKEEILKIKFTIPF